MQRPDHVTQQPKIFLENLLLTLKHFTSLCSALDLDVTENIEFNAPKMTEKRTWGLPDALDSASKIEQTLWVLQVLSNEAFAATDRDSGYPVFEELECTGGKAIDLMCEVAEGTEHYSMTEETLEEWEDDTPTGWMNAIEDILDSLKEHELNQ